MLYFRNETGTLIDDERVRVSNPLCAGACLATEQYRIRLFDTTYGFPRFNNSASQVTILVIQNTADRVVYFNAHFFDTNGVLQGTTRRTSAVRLVVLNTSTCGVAGKSGSIIVNNDGRYGVLTGKASRWSRPRASRSTHRWWRAGRSTRFESRRPGRNRPPAGAGRQPQ